MQNKHYPTSRQRKVGCISPMYMSEYPHDMTSPTALI